jgi:hypothetical protein
MEVSPCGDAYEDGMDDSGEFSLCTNAYERPMICRHCFPDVEM